MQIDDDIESCLRVLKNGGVILYPTDTVWGLGCDATNEKAVDKIFKIKKRAEEKSLIILLSQEEQLKNYVADETPEVYDFIKGIKKPVTIIYNDAKNLAKNVIGNDGSIGIRITEDKFCKKLIAAFGKPIVSTSSNISGYPPPMLFSDIDYEIKSSVDYIVNYRQDETVPGLPSTIIKINKDYTYSIIRS